MIFALIYKVDNPNFIQWEYQQNRRKTTTAEHKQQKCLTDLSMNEIRHKRVHSYDTIYMTVKNR